MALVVQDKKNNISDVISAVARARVKLQGLVENAEHGLIMAKRGMDGINAAAEVARASHVAALDRLQQVLAKTKSDHRAIELFAASVQALPETVRVRYAGKLPGSEELDHDLAEAKAAIALAESNIAQERRRGTVLYADFRTRGAQQHECVERAKETLAEIRQRYKEIANPGVSVSSSSSIANSHPAEATGTIAGGPGGAAHRAGGPGAARPRMRDDLPKGKCPGCGTVEGRSDHKMNRCVPFRAAMDWARANMSDEGKAALGDNVPEETRRRLCQFCGLGDGAAHGRLGKECDMRLQALWHAGAPTVICDVQMAAAAAVSEAQQVFPKGLGKGKGPDLFEPVPMLPGPDKITVPAKRPFSAITATAAPPQSVDVPESATDGWDSSGKEDDDMA